MCTTAPSCAVHRSKAGGVDGWIARNQHACMPLSQRIRCGSLAFDRSRNAHATMNDYEEYGGRRRVNRGALRTRKLRGPFGRSMVAAAAGAFSQKKVGGRQSRARASPVRRCEFLSRPRSCSAVVTLYLDSGRRRVPNPSRMHLVPLQRDRADAASSSPGFFTMSEAQAPLSRRPGCGLCWSRCSRIR
jgi:hypothetical protein